MIDLKVTLKLSDLITEDGKIGKVFDKVMEAGLFIFENKYVSEIPVDEGDFRKGIEVHRNGSLDYVVRSTAKNKNANYPLFLYEGTGRLRGLPDFGFTTGRVRAGEIAYGIGGIRPNKAADRAREKGRSPYIKFVTEQLYKQF